ncbi:MAG: DNA polymerase III subunit delta' [Methyloceanibacter sp.]|nr:DNA polymerase III subunit delta' [Methyloceanibacter sp.]
MSAAKKTAKKTARKAAKSAPKKPGPAPVEPDRLEPFSSPREVDRVFGHDEPAREFEEALQSGRLHHAWLLVGPEGIGKATLAYRLARTVLAHAEAGDLIPGEPADVGPDNPIFRKVAGLAHPNLLLIRRSWMERTKRYSQVISVDEVRRLRSFLGSTAGDGSWRVVIVDRADQLNQNAANALLKALEEPPPDTLFLLVSNAEGRLPVTIRSRTRVLRLSPLNDEALIDAVGAALKRDEIEADDKTLRLAMALSQGSVRRALELVTGEGIGLYNDIVASFEALPNLDGAKVQRQAEKLASVNETEQLELYLALLLGLIERMVRYGATGEGLVGQEESFARRLLTSETLPAWAESWEAISAARAETFALNLDRSLLVLNSWFGLQELASRSTS